MEISDLNSFCPAPWRRGRHELYLGRGGETYCRACGAGCDGETFYSILEEYGIEAGLSVERCEEIASGLPCRAIRAPFEGRPELYMRRFYLGGAVTSESDYDRPIVPRLGDSPWAMYLHSLHIPDERKLHNHPWDCSTSLILNGGYTEDRRGVDGVVFRRTLGPGSVNVIGGTTWHRIVELGGETVWTLFVAGGRQQTWGFWNPEDGSYTHWKREEATAEETEQFLQEIEG